MTAVTSKKLGWLLCHWHRSILWSLAPGLVPVDMFLRLSSPLGDFDPCSILLHDLDRLARAWMRLTRIEIVLRWTTLVLTTLLPMRQWLLTTPLAIKRLRQIKMNQVRMRSILRLLAGGLRVPYILWQLYDNPHYPFTAKCRLLNSGSNKLNREHSAQWPAPSTYAPYPNHGGWT